MTNQTFKFPLKLSEIDTSKVKITKVTKSNIKSLYNDPRTNIYIDEEIVDGFDENEILTAIRNGHPATAVTKI